MKQSLLKTYIGQCKEIKKEIEYFNQKIKEINEDSTVHSVVSASMGPPSYAKTSVTISGTDIKSDKQRKQYEMLLMSAKEKQVDIIIKLEKEVQNIDDCLVRLAIRYKYIEGLSWGQAAQNIGGNNTADSLRKVVHRYLDNL